MGSRVANAQNTQKKSLQIQTLKSIYKPYFSLGVALSPKKMKSEQSIQLFKQHFNSLTAENEMKPQYILRKNGKYCWTYSDAVVKMAKDNDIKLRGHTLVWHNQTPDWFFEDDNGNNISKQELYKRLYVYMKKVMKRYENDVYVWDVVNEAITDANNKGLYRTKKSKWFDICGSEFIGVAFRMAKEINPDVQLYYNDYNLIKPQKRERAYKMLKSLLKQGVPIDGVGMQAHWYVGDSPKMVEKAIERFASLGLRIQITELDVSFFNHEQKHITKDFEFTEDANIEQAKAYAAFFDIFRKHADVIDNVTLWGLSDKHSWLNNHPVKGRRNYPLLFDDQFRPKNAFYSISNFE
ncbi:MAG: endo-1,4-beta-xylanase [Flavicella sp.]